MGIIIVIIIIIIKSQTELKQNLRSSLHAVTMQFGRLRVTLFTTVLRAPLLMMTDGTNRIS